MLKTSFLLLFCCLLAGGAMYGNKPSLVYDQKLNGPEWCFRENKGQLFDENHKPLNDIKYYGKNGGVNVYCQPGMVGFVFVKASEPRYEGLKGKAGLTLNHPITNYEQRKMSFSRAELTFLNSNPDAEITASDAQAFYENYYTTGDANHGITDVHIFKTITYANIYPNIDLVLQTKPNGLKYSFIVHPGGNIADIQIQWNGLDSLVKMENGGIGYEAAGQVYFLTNHHNGSAPLTTLFTECTPVSFQITNNGQRTTDETVTTSFTLQSNRISFNVDNYDKTQTLVIDPTLSWGTYFGGNNADIGSSICMDTADNLYITGCTYSTNGIATKGAYQTSFGGGMDDAFIAKFTSSDSMIWATYYGGNGPELGSAIICDRKNNVYITGTTESASGIATTGAYQTSIGGDSDAFVAKFSSSGSLLWSTYYGGSKNDLGWGITTDTGNSVYITGNTESTSYIATAGAFQTSLAGTANSFIAKFNSAGSLSWASYFGGNNTTGGQGLMSDSGNVYVIGYTSSTSGIATSGAHQTSYGGGSGYNSDAFLAKFTSSGSLSWATYYGGSGDEMGNGICKDIKSNIYITGYTSSSSGIATSGTYMTSLAGYFDVFVAKFAPSGSLKWGTYYGGSGNGNTGYGIATNDSNVYITGVTACKSGIATSGAYHTSFAGGFYDAFLASFDSAGSLTYGTYFGGTSVDGGYSVVADANNNVYFTGWTDTSNGIATSGAYQTKYGGSGDAFIAKFSFGAPKPTPKKYKNDAGIDSFIIISKGPCAYQYNTDIVLKNYGSDTLRSVKIGSRMNQNINGYETWTGKLPPDSSVKIIYVVLSVKSGSDTVVAWTSIPNGVADSNTSNDTFIRIDTFLPLPNINQTSYGICKGSSVTIGDSAIKGYKYKWTIFNNYTFKDTTARLFVKPDTTTYYRLEVTGANGCMQSEEVTVNVGIPPKANAGKSKTMCKGSVDSIGSASINGYQYSWTSRPQGFTSTQAMPVVSPTMNTTYYLKVNNNGCTDSDSVSITISGPNLIPSTTTYTICSADSLKIGDAPIAHCTYQWEDAVHRKVLSFHTSQLSLKPRFFIVYTETITDTVLGCSSSTYITINVNPNPNATTKYSVSICPGDSVSIGAAPDSGNLYSWTSDPSGFTSSLSDPVVKPSTSITYYLTETDTSTGCHTTNPSMVTLTPALVYPGSAQSLCLGDPARIGGILVSGNTYSWTSIPAGFHSSVYDPLVSPTTTTIYMLKVKNKNGCSDTGSVVITVNPLPDALFTTNISGLSVSCQPKDSLLAFYSWQFGDSDTSSARKPLHTYGKSGIYTINLTVKDTNGCSKTDTQSVTVINTSSSIFHPICLAEASPNPFSSAIQLSVSGFIPSVGHISITDMQGREVFNENYYFTQDFKEKLNLAGLQSGLYIIKIITQYNSYSLKVSKM